MQQVPGNVAACTGPAELFSGNFAACGILSKGLDSWPSIHASLHFPAASRAGHHDMLPGLRILFATTVLAISILVFGLGAAALLRAAHEEFASLPAWRLAQQPVLTPFTPQVPRIETTPVLAMLRIEAPGGTKPLPETLRREPDVATYQPPLQAALTPPADDAAVQDSGSAVTDANEATASAPVSNQPAASDAPAGVSTPVEEANAPDVNTLDVRESGIAGLANVKPAELKSAEPKTSESKATELKPIDITSLPNLSPTEATEPLSTVTSIERSSEATAFAVEPRPVVKKARRSSARAIAQRREAARARAAARTQAEQLRQQQKTFPLFGG